MFAILIGKGGCDFAAPVVYSGGYGAGTLKAADVDGDKRLDLLISVGEIGVALGKGDGTFRAPRVQYTGASPSGLGLGDLDGDGKLDLVTGQPNDKSLAVSLGHGDGSFGTPTRFSLSNKPGQVIVADISGDGVPDVIVGLTDIHSFAVLFGDGKGGLGAPQIFAVGLHCAVGDLNGDGKLDIAVTDDMQLWAYVSDGHGGLTAGPPVTAGANIWGLSLGDLNGDGRLDAALVDWQGAALSIALSLGDHFAAVQPYPALGQTIAVQVNDFDGDGQRDVLLTQQDGMVLSYYPGKGDGTLKNALAIPFDGYAPSNDGVLLADA